MYFNVYLVDLSANPIRSDGAAVMAKGLQFQNPLSKILLDQELVGEFCSHVITRLASLQGPSLLFSEPELLKNENSFRLLPAGMKSFAKQLRSNQDFFQLILTPSLQIFGTRLVEENKRVEDVEIELAKRLEALAGRVDVMASRFVEIEGKLQREAARRLEAETTLMAALHLLRPSFGRAVFFRIESAIAGEVDVQLVIVGPDLPPFVSKQLLKAVVVSCDGEQVKVDESGRLHLLHVCESRSYQLRATLSDLEICTTSLQCAPSSPAALVFDIADIVEAGAAVCLPLAAMDQFGNLIETAPHVQVEASVDDKNAIAAFSSGFVVMTAPLKKGVHEVVVTVSVGDVRHSVKKTVQVHPAAPAKIRICCDPDLTAREPFRVVAFLADSFGNDISRVKDVSVSHNGNVLVPVLEDVYCSPSSGEVDISATWGSVQSCSKFKVKRSLEASEWTDEEFILFLSDNGFHTVAAEVKSCQLLKPAQLSVSLRMFKDSLAYVCKLSEPEICSLMKDLPRHERAKWKSTRYEVEKSLGRGGQGEVFLALDKSLKRRVAIKQFGPLRGGGNASEEKCRQRLQREAEIALPLIHPNVVKVFDFLPDEGMLVMEYIGGIQLLDALKRTPKPSFVDVFSQVLSGLHYLHSNGIFHRDIAPDNILVSVSSHRVVIIDLGISKRLDDSSFSMSTASSAGRWSYFSPERKKGGTLFTFQDDLWAVAVCMFQVLEDKLPMTERPSSELEKTPPVLHSVLERAFDNVPTKRFKSAQEFLEALVAAGLEPSRLIECEEDVALALSEEFPAARRTDAGILARQPFDDILMRKLELVKERSCARIERLALWDTALVDKIKKHCALKRFSVKHSKFCELTFAGDKVGLIDLLGAVDGVVNQHMDEAANCTVNVAQDSDEFDHISKTCMSHCGGTHPTLAYRVTALRRVCNSKAELSFRKGEQWLGNTVRWGYHGTAPSVLEKICREGLRAQGDGTIQPTDSGWFGDGTKGVYCTGHFDYCLQYCLKTSNGKLSGAVGPNQTFQFLMVRLRPGREHILNRSLAGMQPSDLHDSHATGLSLHEQRTEWFLYRGNNSQGNRCPTDFTTQVCVCYVVSVETSILRTYGVVDVQ